MKNTIDTSEKENTVLTVKYRLTGIVQNVGFRHFLAQTAKRLSVCGWAKNEGDGSLILLLSGDVDAVQQMLRQAQSGPPAATVSNFVELMVEESDIPPLDGFEQR